MALKLPDSAVPMGDFPVAKAVDIDFDDGENLQEKLDNGKLGGGGNTSDLTDLENRITTNEVDITDLQEQTSDLQEQIDNLDIPDSTDLTEINTKLTRLETNQIKNINLIDMDGNDPIYKIKPSGTNHISKISMVDLYGGCILITGSAVSSEYKPFKVVRLSNGNWESYYPSLTGANKLDKVYYDGSFIYVKCNKYIKCYIEGGFETVEKVTTLPTGVTELPILDLTQQTDLTGINTKLSQLETKANLIPLVSDNPTEYDLNNYKENGNYSIGDPTKYSNVPIARPALLTVIRSNSYRLQIYTIVTINDVYFRKSTDWGSTWSSWVLLNGEVDLSSINSKLTQLENTINEVGGGGIYQSGEIEVGTWTGGQKLYRYTISDNTERTFTSGTGTMMLDFFTLSRNEYAVVKLDGTFRMCAAHDNSGAHTVYALPYVDLDTNRQVELVYTTMDKVRLSGSNLNNYKILGFDVSIYYYKK